MLAWRVPNQTGVTIEVADGIALYNDFYLDIDTSLLKTGRVIAWKDVNWGGLATDCSVAGAHCWDTGYNNARPSGTIEVVEAGGIGHPLKLRFDLTFPASCKGGKSPCTAVYHLEGDLADTLDLAPDERDLPFYTTDWFCDTHRCHGTSEAYTNLVKLCDLATMAEINGHLDGLADELRDVAIAFDTAGDDASLEFMLPAGRNPLLADDAHLDAADAKALAAAVWGAVFSLEMGAQYDLIDPTIDPDSLVSLHHGPSRSGGTCSTKERWGIPMSDLEEQFDDNLGYPASGADFAEAEAAMKAMFESVAAVLDTAPTGRGVVDFGGTHAGLSAYRTTVKADIDAAVAGFVSPTELPSSPSISLHPVTFFTTPYTQSALLTAAGVGSVTYLDGACEQDLYIYDSVGEALLYELGTMATLPAEIIDDAGETGPCGGGCDTNVSECVGGTCVLYTPALVDEDLFETVLDNNDWPRFLDETAIDVLSPLIGEDWK